MTVVMPQNGNGGGIKATVLPPAGTSPSGEPIPDVTSATAPQGVNPPPTSVLTGSVGGLPIWLLAVGAALLLFGGGGSKRGRRTA